MTTAATAAAVREQKEAKKEDRRRENDRQAERNYSLANRLRSAADLENSNRAYALTWGGVSIRINPWEISKVILITGGVVLAIVTTAFIIKLGVEALVRYITSAGTSVDVPVSDGIADTIASQYGEN